MPETVKLYAVVLGVFALLDFVWLGLMMPGFYRTELAGLLRTADGAFAPLWPPAVMVYGLLTLGIVGFVLPRVEGMGLLAAFGWGAVFGVVVYGVYELTNLATLARWSIRLTVADIAWGAVICGATTAAARGATIWFRS